MITSSGPTERVARTSLSVTSTLHHFTAVARQISEWIREERVTADRYVGHGPLPMSISVELDTDVYPRLDTPRAGYSCYHPRPDTLGLIP